MLYESFQWFTTNVLCCSEIVKNNINTRLPHLSRLLSILTKNTLFKYMLKSFKRYQKSLNLHCVRSRFIMKWAGTSQSSSDSFFCFFFTAECHLCSLLPGHSGTPASLRSHKNGQMPPQQPAHGISDETETRCHICQGSNVQVSVLHKVMLR